MAIRYVIVSLLVLALAADVTSQFFDFFSGLQPFQAYEVARPQKHHTEHTTRRIKGDTNRRTDKQTNKPEHITRRYEEDRRNTAVSFQFEGNERDGNIRQVAKEKIKRKQTTLAPFFGLFYTTTSKPIRKTTKSSLSNHSSHKNINANNTKGNNNDNSNHKIRNQALVSEYNLDTGSYDTKVNNIGEEFYITRPNYDNNNNNDYYINNRPNNNFGSNNNNFNTYTTQNPFYNTPGVKPAVIDNRPPITNKPRPVTQRPNFGTSAVSKDYSPEIINGPDEDSMSDAEKRRHIEMAERMCDKYKALNMKQLQAIPLIPSPEPIQVNVSECTPTTIPLVVGGKVVTIQDFPHMALLGWLKLNGGGYSWKCGGSLVSDQYVLTAAHCAFQERDNSVITGPPRAVQLGSSYLDDPGALIVKVSTVIRHPKYKLPMSYYDLALLKLATPVTFSDVVRPACLGVPPSAGDHIIATGWGRTEFGGEQSTELRSVSLPVWNIDECWNVLGTSRKLPDGPSAVSQICAGDVRGGRDTCQGDSGGPAQIQDGCLWRIVAVTSLGRSCGAQNTPGLYAKVHRAFVAAQVFGGQKNNNNNSNKNNNSNRNNNNEQQNNSFRSNSNGRSNNYETTSNDYNNYNRNNNNNYDVNNNYSNQQQNYNNFNNGNYGQDNNYYTNNYNNANSQPYYNTDRTRWTW